MRRIGVPLLAAVPVAIAAGIFFLSPSDSSGSSEEPDTTSQSAVGEDGEAAKGRAEEKRSADDKAIAALPPGLAAPAKKELAQQIVASAENSTLDWRTAYAYIEDIGDGQGYTAGVIGFCTGTHDLLTLVERYTKDHPDNGLARYLPALREVDGTDSHEGLDPGFTAAWKAEAKVEAFREAQDAERDRVYFDPAVRVAKLDGLGALGQFIYYDAMVFHGPGTDATSFYGLREAAMKKADPPSEGGSEEAYLSAFLDVRKAAMRTRKADIDTSRVDTAQRRFLREGKLELETPLTWAVYGETYRVP
ncbi:chitosanase [Streptomyces sp. TLI_55]|uniref:chitosanase n=1 Tax=Streptomyces sp. TLI_55 TaxID=1938861 RepID=UPI000BDAC78B|nr:chitosanase [Streptomyces sp. TLI_55]SNX57739.1 chitosanase [Streptomyces sp. TLI_55]